MPTRELRALAGLLPLGLGVAMIDAPWSRFPDIGAVLVIAACLLRARSRAVAGRLPGVLLVVWTFASVVWSLMPGGTMVAAVRTLLVLVAAVMLVRTLPGPSVATVVSLGTSALSALALVWLVLFPATATSADGLKGMMPQNNALAYVTAVAVVSTMLAAGYPRWLRLGLLALNAVTLVLTDSMTSLLAAAAALVAAGAVLLEGRLSRVGRQALAVLVGGVLASLAYLSANVPVTSLLGRDATLTGRTDIWPDLWPVATQRWLTGWGHGAPWLKGSWIREWAAFHFNFSMISTHNALYETFMQLGIIGVTLVVVLWAGGIGRAVLGAHLNPANGWLVAFAALQLVHGMAESTQGAPLGWLVAALVWFCRPEPSSAAHPEPTLDRAPGRTGDETLVHQAGATLARQ